MRNYTRVLNRLTSSATMLTMYQTNFTGVLNRLAGSEAMLGVDGVQIPSQQRETLYVPQVPIRLTNIWYGRLCGIVDRLPF